MKCVVSATRSPSKRIRAPHRTVLQAITTTAGHRGWWADDCDVGSSAGAEAVYRFGALEVVFRIDLTDSRGIEMTCVRTPNFPDWQGTRLTIRAIEDGAGTYVDILHDGYPTKNAVYETCASQWSHYAKSLLAFCETGRGEPFTSNKS
jgi:hypothetical protein